MAKMKKSEIVLWVSVFLLFIANLFAQRHPRYSWETDLSQRYAVDFCREREEVKEYVARYIPDVTDAQIDEWTENGKLESMVIGKKVMYFRNAGPNLFRIDPELAAIKASSDKKSAQDLSMSGTSINDHTVSDAKTNPAIRAEVLRRLYVGGYEGNPYLALPRRIRMTFKLTVPANTLRPGKTLRCWLPYPRQDVARQTDVKFVEAGVNNVKYPAGNIIFSEPSCAHSSLYMEAKTRRGQETTFYEVFEYTSSGEWHPVDSSKVLPYDTESPEYKEYTSEREKHVIFSPRIKALADSLTAGIDNPYSQAKAIYTYVDRVPWASAREYSTIENIPEYVLSTGHGDCGQVTLLFMTLCRYKGIPVRWQSGLMTHPDAGNLHDWGEIYFEGYGWMPVDQSFGITSYGGYFYFGGIDPYRMVVNSDFGREFSPKKKFPRSETVDFQRGEVEWEYDNLYFNQWSYDFDIQYL